jgi:hypothetical protein
MKKIFVLTVLMTALWAAQPVFSQNWLVGGALTFQHQAVNSGILGQPTATATIFGLMPQVLYALNNSFDIGGTIGFVWEKDNSTTFEIGPIGRFKFLNLDRVTVFAEGYLTYAVTSFDAGGPNGNTFSIGTILGGDISITDNILFFLQLGGIEFSHAWRNSYNENSFTFLFITQNPVIGIMFRF